MPRLVISARLAPLPPRRSFISRLPSEKSYTYFGMRASGSLRLLGVHLPCGGRQIGPLIGSVGSAGSEPLVQVADQGVHADPFLRHGVTFAYGHGSVLE